MTDARSASSPLPERDSVDVVPVSPTEIRLLPTGVPGLDLAMGGGLPEFSFNVLAGDPGAGKTTLAQQIIFANATPERPALYFTVLGEPTIKMLRYQQQFRFFQQDEVGAAVRYINLSDELLTGDLRRVFARISAEVERTNPGIVVVDSFRSLRPNLDAPNDVAAAPDRMSLEHFVEELALFLTGWEVTSLLIGEYGESEQRSPLFTIADGILWLTQAVDRNSVVRKLQVVKVRGREQVPGLHTFRITTDGIRLFPRIPSPRTGTAEISRSRSRERLSSGVPGLDALMGGGIPAGDAVMIAGPTGTGKSTFAMQFAAEGLRRGEAVVIAAFEEFPEAYLDRLRSLEFEPDALIASGKLLLSHLRPLDLSVDETLAEILEGVTATGARRVVIDSLTGFELALAPTFREDFRESLYRLIGALTSAGVTVFTVLESVAMSPNAGFTGERVSHIIDDLITLRYVELDGALQPLLSVVKMRASRHNREFRRYEINDTGAVVGDPLTEYGNILSGSPALLPVKPLAIESSQLAAGQPSLTPREGL